MEFTRRQGEILEAASKLLLRKGIQGFTTKNLAIQVKFSEAALYRHFKNKETIIISMLSYLASEMEERLVALNQDVHNPAKKIKNIYNEQFKFLSKNKHYLIVAFSDGLWEDNKNIYEAVNNILEANKKHISSIVSEGIAEGKFSKKVNKQTLENIVMGAYRQHLLEWKMAKYKTDIVATGKELAKDIVKLIK